MNDVFVLFIVFYEVDGKAHRTLFSAGGFDLFVFVAGTERVDGQKRYLAGAVIL